jgi:hypothetical protein
LRTANPDQERIRRQPGVQPECNFQGGALGIRQAFHEVEGRRAQLVERGERQLHLPFDPDGAGRPHPTLEKPSRGLKRPHPYPYQRPIRGSTGHTAAEISAHPSTNSS